MLAKYAQDQDLLNKPGWRFLCCTAKCIHFANAALNATHHHSDPCQTRNKFSVQVPKSYQDAMHLDKDNGNTLWADAICLEMDQIMDYRVFQDLGHNA